MTRPKRSWVTTARAPGRMTTDEEREYVELRREALDRGEVETTEWLVAEADRLVYVDRAGVETSFPLPGRRGQTVSAREEGSALTLTLARDASAYLVEIAGQPGRVFRVSDSDGEQIPVSSLRTAVEQELAVNWPRTAPPRRAVYTLELQAWDPVLERWALLPRVFPPRVVGLKQAQAIASSLVDAKDAGIGRVIIRRNGVEEFVVER